MVSYHVRWTSVERSVANSPANEPSAGASPTDAVSDPPGTRCKRWTIPGALLAAFLLIGACGAYFSMFSQFWFYDDEGYLLISLRQFIRGHALYDEVFSQYGPFYHLVHGILFKATGWTVSHDAGRLLSLAEAVGIALLAAMGFFRLTGNRWLSAVVPPIVLQALQPLFAEPGHPQTLALLLVFAVALSAGKTTTWNGRHAAVLGAWVGCILMTKINVGLFVLLALAWTAAIFSSGGCRRATSIVVGLAILALPWVLMRAHLDLAAVLSYALAISMSFLAIAIVCRSSLTIEPRMDRRSWLAGMAGCGAAVALISAATLLTGTSLDGLLGGVAWRPGKTLFYLPAGFDVESVAWSVLSLACVLRVRGGPPTPGSFSFAAILALKAGLGILTALQQWPALLDRALPFVWIGLLPAPRDSQGNRASFGRVFLVSLTVVHALVAYPVAGAQKAVALAPMVVIGVLCLHDAWRMWNAMSPAEAARLRRIAAFVLLAGATLVHQGIATVTAMRRRQAGLPLELPGARLLRLPGRDRDQLREIVRELGPYETFVTVPGMNSLYLLAQKEPPTGLNCTAWMFLLNEAEQERIARAVERQPRVCVVYNADLLGFWGRGLEFEEAPLMRTLRRDFRPVKSVGKYEIHERSLR